MCARYLFGERGNKSYRYGENSSHPRCESWLAQTISTYYSFPFFFIEMIYLSRPTRKRLLSPHHTQPALSAISAWLAGPLTRLLVRALLQPRPLKA